MQWMDALFSVFFKASNVHDKKFWLFQLWENKQKNLIKWENTQTWFFTHDLCFRCAWQVVPSTKPLTKVIISTVLISRIIWLSAVPASKCRSFPSWQHNPVPLFTDVSKINPVINCVIYLSIIIQICALDEDRVTSIS